MQTLQWQFFEEEDQSDSTQKQNPQGMEVEEKGNSEAAQLLKYQDQYQDKNRQGDINLLDKFGVLLTSKNLPEIAKDLLTEDVEVFLFSSTGRTRVRYAKGPDDFINLYKDVQIHERRVRETHVDTERSTACQVSSYSISYPDSNEAEEEFACEIFSIRDGRISKLRASFGRPVYNPEFLEDPLEPTRKDRMLAKVKEINYALAGKPDFERVASLLPENVEYKIWRWEDFQCFTLNKSNFVQSFSDLQENMTITTIVPYELYSETQGKFIASTYVYHLEDKRSGQKFIWLSTCTYSFDGNLNIARVNQQGELRDEGDAIPFETFPREKFEGIMGNFYTSFEACLEMMYSDQVLYDCIFWDFTIAGAPNPGPYKGLKHIDKLMESIEVFKTAKPEYVKFIDVYVDNYNRSHDVGFGILCSQGPNFMATGPDDPNKILNALGFVRMAFENGKVAKVIEFLSVVITPIPSPFDDKSFECANIKPLI